MAGKSLRDIAKTRGTTPENIGILFKSRGLNPELTKVCEIPECGKTFVTKLATGRTCSRKHLKLLASREERGVTSSLILCAIPECEKLIWMLHPQGKKPDFGGASGQGKRFCCHSHTELASNRRRHSWYRRFFSKREKCIAPGCRERIVLDEHHTQFKGNRSNKKSATVWACPTHHMYIHRGLAKIENGKFVSLIPTIKKGIKLKMKLFSGYKKSLGL